ncbi:MAG: anaerobic ribonucleoside-triphosphate reductase activating protein [Candidatus Woesearchaeota archaeon]
MKFFGLQKLSMVDYPGHLCATIFTQGCNMRCSYCHNPELIFLQKQSNKGLEETEILKFLQKRKDQLEGVCITGGEPTIHGDALIESIRKIKSLGYRVKLDTNGTNPTLVKKLIAQKLVDYIAMDVKGDEKFYEVITKTNSSLYHSLLQTIELLKQNMVDYEFRITLFSNHHTDEMMDTVARLISGAKVIYLQKGNPKTAWCDSFHSLEAVLDEQMSAFQKIFEKHQVMAKVR